jgi:hypothetical protein
MNNNPVRYNDPTGHCIFGLDTAVCVAVGLGIVIGAAIDYGIQVYDNVTSKKMEFSDAINPQNIDLKSVAVNGFAGGVGAAIFGPVQAGLSRVLWSKGLANSLAGGLSGIGSGQAAAIFDAAWNQVENVKNGKPLDANQFKLDARDAGLLDRDQIIFDGVSGGLISGVAGGIIDELTTSPSSAVYLTASGRNQGVIAKGALAGLFKHFSKWMEEIVQRSYDKLYDESHDR